MAKTYDTYKDSGIAWIGEIPSEWEVCRMKNISIISSGDIISKEEYMDNGQYPIIGSNGEIGRINKINNNKNVLTTGRVGSIGTVQLVKDSWITDNALIINITSDDNIRYIYYALPLLDYQLISTGTAQPLISASALKTQSLPLPSVKEQQSITSFLDSKCAEIDALISLQEEMISELQAYKQSVITEAVTKGLNPHAKMKDSGVEWIGEIPEEWNIKRLKYLCTIATGNKDTQDSESDGIYKFYVRSPIIERSNSWTFEGEGILMAGDGAGAGRVFHHAFGKYAVHQRVYRMANFRDINTYFLFYYLSSLFCKIMDMGSAQSTVPSVRLPMLTNFFVCCPPLTEQQSIANYLDEKTSQIDSLITLKQEKIQELKDYKKSIIYEYVTGKKRV